MALGHSILGNFSTKGLMNPKDIGFSDSIDIIKDEFTKMQRSYIKIGYYLKHIKDNELYLEGGYSNIWDCAKDQFGLSQDSASRYINTCIKYSIGNDSPDLDDKYLAFSKSQLLEMLPMSYSQIEENISPDMTVKEIREVKAALNEKPIAPIHVSENTKDDESDDDIPGQMDVSDYPELTPDVQNPKIIEGKFHEVIDDNTDFKSYVKNILKEAENKTHLGIIPESSMNWFAEKLNGILHKYTSDMASLEETLVDLASDRLDDSDGAYFIEKISKLF